MTRQLGYLARGVDAKGGRLIGRLGRLAQVENWGGGGKMTRQLRNLGHNDHLHRLHYLHHSYTTCSKFGGGRARVVKRARCARRFWV